MTGTNWLNGQSTALNITGEKLKHDIIYKYVHLLVLENGQGIIINNKTFQDVLYWKMNLLFGGNSNSVSHRAASYHPLVNKFPITAWP